MSMNYSDPTRPTASATEDEGLLFAPVPAWERGRKRRGLGGMKTQKRVTETRTFASPDTIATDARDAPIGHTRMTAARKTGNRGVPAVAVAAGVLALAAVGGAGWYMSQDNDAGVAELTPGVTESSPAALATAPIAPPVAVETRPTQMASAEPARASTTTARRTTTARARPAAALSASEQGVNASGAVALPAGPQPYDTLRGATAGSPSATPPAPAAPVTEVPVTATPPVSVEPVPVNPPASEAAPTPAEEPTAPDPT